MVEVKGAQRANRAGGKGDQSVSVAMDSLVQSIDGVEGAVGSSRMGGQSRRHRVFCRSGAESYPEPSRNGWRVDLAALTLLFQWFVRN